MIYIPLGKKILLQWSLYGAKFPKSSTSSSSAWISIFHIFCQEIEELMAQIYGSVAKVDVAFSLPDLASALKQIQAQYDSIAAQNLQVKINTIK